MAKWYVTDYIIQKNGKLEGMAIAGPFNERWEADNTHTLLGLDGMLTVGPDDLGPDWQNNITKWRNGELD